MWNGEQDVQVLNQEGSDAVAKRGIFETRPFRIPSPKARSPSSIPGLDLDDVVRRGLAHPGGTDPDIAGFLPKLAEIGRAEVAHAGLDSADQLGEDQVKRGGNLLERLHTFGRDLLRTVGRMTVTRGRPA